MSGPTRAQVEGKLGHKLADGVWDYGQRQGFIDPALDGSEAVTYAVGKFRELERAVGQRVPRESRAPRRAGRSGARELALGAIYTQVVARAFETKRIRRRAGGPMAVGAIASWVAVGYLAALQAPDVDSATAAIGEVVSQGEPTADLAYPDPQGRGRLLTVPKRSHLGELAEWCQKVADRYRWVEHEATRVILTGESRPVSWAWVRFSIRYGELSATSRVTLTMDPDLEPGEVADLYRMARRTITPAERQRVRPLGEQALARLAWVAGRDTPATWGELLAAWNRSHPDMRHPGPARNFGRDVRAAYRRVTDPGWRLLEQNQQREGKP